MRKAVPRSILIVNPVRARRVAIVLALIRRAGASRILFHEAGSVEQASIRLMTLAPPFSVLLSSAARCSPSQLAELLAQIQARQGTAYLLHEGELDDRISHVALDASSHIDCRFNYRAMAHVILP